MVTVRTRKLGTCRLGKPHWNAGQRQTSAGTERWFLEGQSLPRSNAFRFEPRTTEHWHSRVQVFPRPLERSRVSSWVSCICWSFWQLQSQPHWPRWWHSVGGRHCPKCRPLLHCSSVKPSGRLPLSRTSPCGSFMLGTPDLFIHLFSYLL